MREALIRTRSGFLKGPDSEIPKGGKLTSGVWGSCSGSYQWGIRSGLQHKQGGQATDLTGNRGHSLLVPLPPLHVRWDHQAIIMGWERVPPVPQAPACSECCPPSCLQSGGSWGLTEIRRSPNLRMFPSNSNIHSGRAESYCSQIRHAPLPNIGNPGQILLPSLLR